MICARHANQTQALPLDCVLTMSMRFAGHSCSATWSRVILEGSHQSTVDRHLASILDGTPEPWDPHRRRAVIIAARSDLDYAAVLEAIRDHLAERDVAVAVVGGWALNSYGGGRTTFDLDLVVPAAAQAELVTFLESLGYETLHVSAGYSNHLHGETSWGRVDVVYVRGTTEEEIFACATERTVFPGHRALVPAPEHLVAMKVTAMKNDPSRRLQDLADIRALLELTGIPPESVRPSFVKQGLESEYEEITDRE